MKHLILGTAGHVDHGKTALVKALTDIDCDTHKEEKERGITINLGFSHLNLPTGESIGIVDVPGHKDFIKTMVAGAFGIDIVLLVIAADSGIMPQTEEHLKIIEMLGVEHGIVVINKIDLVDEETAELAELEISEYLEGTRLENAPIVKVSSIKGTGLNELITVIQETIPLIKGKESGELFRMYIDRIFNVKGVGFVVTGSVLEGSIGSGDDLYLLPGKAKKVKIRNIERHGSKVEKVYCGDRAAINLSGLKSEDYSRGMVLTNKVLEDSYLIDATLDVFDPETVLGIWSTVVFYTGTFECNAKIHLLDKNELHPGDKGIVQIKLSTPSILSVKDKFIIRNSSNDKTIGGGDVIDINPLHHKKKTPKLVASLLDLADATLNSDKVTNLIKIELNKINAPVFIESIAETLSKSAEELLKDIEEEKPENITIINSENRVILVRSELDQSYKDTIIKELKAFHAKNPILEEGLGAKEYVGKFQFGKNEAGKVYLENVMLQLHQDKKTRKVGNTWALVSHETNVDHKTEKELQWLEDIYRNSGMDIPLMKKTEEMAHERKINKDRLKMLLKYLSFNGILTYFEGEFLHSDIVNSARKHLIAKIVDDENGINEKEYREIIGATRKFIQLVLGIFIKEKIVIKPKFYIKITQKGTQLASKIL